jgi:F-type H+-transporting ATPase subunit gamma
MANLKEVRNRIVSITSTQQITKAMKMVSAAKLRRAQDAIIQMRPYANKLQEILQNVSGSVDASEGGQFSKVREVKSVLIVVVTSNRGLCGAFNMNVIICPSTTADSLTLNISVLVGATGVGSSTFVQADNNTNPNMKQIFLINLL